MRAAVREVTSAGRHAAPEPPDPCPARLRVTVTCDRAPDHDGRHETWLPNGARVDWLGRQW
jgi:hypothetical protein